MTNNSTPSHSVSDGRRRLSRGGLAAGLTAGLVGGSLAGLAFGVSGTSSAASDDLAAPVAIVQQTDTGTSTDTRPAAPAEVGDRLRDILQELVDDGTLTATQADAVTTHLIENRPERGERDGHRVRGALARSGVLTDVLGIDAQTLRDELRSGSTLADIAEANGVEISELIDAIVDEASDRLDVAVSNGRLTAEEAAERLAQFEQRVTDKINGG